MEGGWEVAINRAGQLKPKAPAASHASCLVNMHATSLTSPAVLNRTPAGQSSAGWRGLKRSARPPE